MSARACDGHGRWRSQTIGVRVSPEENEQINTLAALCGMSKQTYTINRMLQKDVIVVGNPRVYKALKDQMEQLCQKLALLSNVEEISPETLEVLEFMGRIYDGMKKHEEA